MTIQYVASFNQYRSCKNDQVYIIVNTNKCVFEHIIYIYIIIDKEHTINTTTGFFQTTLIEIKWHDRQLVLLSTNRSHIISHSCRQAMFVKQENYQPHKPKGDGSVKWMYTANLSHNDFVIFRPIKKCMNGQMFEYD